MSAAPDTDDLFPRETQAVVSLASLYVLRMLGLFMVLPVLALYAESFTASTPLLIGLALGAYGFSQAILQIPFGLLSDRIGRKPVIVGGLLLFAAGSLVAANAESIYGVIVGRLMQGSGAIASTLMALVSDLTSERNRSKAMAAIGASIGVSFAISLVLGPMLSSYGGVAGIFWATAILAALGLGIVFFAVPAAPQVLYTSREVRAVPELLGAAFRDKTLLRLNSGIFILHFVLMANFLVVPLLLRDVVGLAPADHWQAYLPLMFFSFVAMLPLMVMAEKKHKVKQVFLIAVALMGLSLWLLAGLFDESLHLLGLLFVFFVAFNLLEAMLPSLVSKSAAAGFRGTAMGVYSSSQFFGAFAGGVAGGFLVQYGGVEMLLLTSAALVGLWFVIALTMEQPRHLKNIAVSLHVINGKTSEELLAIAGVEEVLVIAEHKRAYLKVDEGALDNAALQKLAC